MSDDTISAQDIREFTDYLRFCTDDQVRNIFHKERSAGREAYAELARNEARSRNISLDR